MTFSRLPAFNSPERLNCSWHTSREKPIFERRTMKPNEVTHEIQRCGRILILPRSAGRPGRQRVENTKRLEVLATHRHRPATLKVQFQNAPQGLNSFNQEPNSQSKTTITSTTLYS